MLRTITKCQKGFKDNEMKSQEALHEDDDLQLKTRCEMAVEEASSPVTVAFALTFVPTDDEF